MLWLGFLFSCCGGVVIFFGLSVIDVVFSYLVGCYRSGGRIFWVYCCSGCMWLFGFVLGFCRERVLIGWIYG